MGASWLLATTAGRPSARRLLGFHDDTHERGESDGTIAEVHMLKKDWRHVMATGVLMLGACASSVEEEWGGEALDEGEVGSVSQASVALGAIATPIINLRTPSMGPPPSSPSGIPASGLCLDVVDGSSAPEARVQIYPCHNQSNQKWVYHPSSGLLRAANSGLCLDVVNGVIENGSAVQMYPCHGGPNQQWWWEWDGTIGAYNAAGVRKCLDVPNHATSATHLQIWDCHRDDNQVWTRPPTTVRNAASGRCLDVRTQDGTTIQLWDCHSGANQQWVMEFGRYFQSKFNSLYMNAYNTDGTVTLSSMNHNFYLAGDGTIRPTDNNYINPKCLEGDDWVQPNGTLAAFRGCNNSAKQIWILQ